MTKELDELIRGDVKQLWQEETGGGKQIKTKRAELK